MKVAVITDLHFGARNDHPTILAYQTRFLEETFFLTLKREGVEHLLILGDTFDKRRVHNIATLKHFREHFFKRIDIPTTFIIGNHDCYYTTTNSVNSVTPLAEEFPLFTVIEETGQLTLDGHRFAFLSWLNKENQARNLEWVKTLECDTLCAHLELNAFEMLPGIKCEHGLDAALFSHIPQVWTGHFHIPSSQGNIDYIGNPFEFTWADYGTAKRFFIFDTQSKALKPYDNPRRLFKAYSWAEASTVSDTALKDCFIRLRYDSTQVEETELRQLITHWQAQAASLELIDTAIQAEISQIDVTNLTDTKTAILSTLRAMKHKRDANRLERMMVDLYDRSVA